MIRRRVLKYYRNYLTIKSLADNNDITFIAPFQESPILTIYVSADGGSTWNEATSTLEGTLLATLDSGEELIVKGTNRQYGNIYNNGVACAPSAFRSSKNIALKGNVMSLLYGDDFEGKYEFPDSTSNIAGVFYGNPNLVNIDDLILPATTLSDHCYALTFLDCKGLTSVPRNLLPATTLAPWCYYTMFQSCSITEAPELPASTLVESCYRSMFRYCSSLNYIKCLAVNHSATYCTNVWVDRVASSGTFVKASSASWSRGTSAVPNNWSLVNAS